VCLIAAELERRNISTVVVQLLRFVAEKVKPPRALYVPFLHGYPLAAPNEPEKQHAVIEAALRLFEDDSSEPPVLVDYESARKEVSV
jgi:hypothetical protein